MSNLTLVANQWHDNINQVEKVEPIVGGSSGNANLAAKQLAENILWLRQNMQAHKVGDIYTTTLAHANAAAVAAHHGYGVWERYAEGRTLVGLSTITDDPIEYKTIGNEFGKNTHTLTEAESAKHVHKLVLENNTGGVVDVAAADSLIFVNDKTVTSNTNGGPYYQGETVESGGGQPHNNIQPSKVVGHWLRTA